ncbi:hypothetical protein LTR84_010711 [Exophiala bonariae]|uniref:NADP-dependent oxidoreductase domain-containing protein n=1 Tax=Exophiala bonariae TaxID=1690606 RepID=A0AAV9MV80_9EURO|nr:hypothetical protein LTR84_010711 [Exophiala bonariae]
MSRAHKTHPELVLGTANFGSASDPITKTTTPERAAELLTILYSSGSDTIDTAQRYPPFAQGTSEKLLGETFALLHKTTSTTTSTTTPHHAVPSKSTIKLDTKVLSNPGDHTIPRINASIASSLASLAPAKIHTIYAHAPDPDTPLSSPASAFHDAVIAGHAAQWGISNYSLEQVRELLQICDAHGWVRPAVYQGRYNAVARGAEAELIPYLHGQGIAFYAFAPGASGTFGAASRLELQNAVGEAMRGAYGADQVRVAVERVRSVVAEKGLGSAHEVVVRWVVWHSALDRKFGDKVIFGTGGPDQLRAMLEAVERGPLEPDVVEVVEQVWPEVSRKD